MRMDGARVVKRVGRFNFWAIDNVDNRFLKELIVWKAEWVSINEVNKLVCNLVTHRTFVRSWKTSKVSM